MKQLQDIQHSLPSEYKYDVIFRDRLLNAVSGIEACRIAKQKPTSTVEGIISDFQAAVATFVQEEKSSHAMIVDRKFMRRNDRRGRVCIVCRKPGCWSTNHPLKERMAALKKNP